MNARSVTVIGGAVALLYALLLVAGTVLRSGSPMPSDILAFLAAARLAVGGQAALAYDWAALRDVQAAILGIPPEALGGALGWLNPPHFFFAVLPLAPFDYGWAWLVWSVATALLLGLACWSVLPRPAAVLGVLAAPATLLTLSVGQNGMLVAALFAWTFAWLDRRPVLAGVALGLLTIKPQFGLLLPVLLALTGRWRAFGVAGGVALAAMAVSLAAFGPDAWLAFLPSLGGNAGRMLGGEVSPRIQSVYAFLARLGAGQGLAMGGHGVVALAAVALVLRLWLARPERPEEVRAASAIAVSYLLTPYVWGYDMPIIAVAALFLARAALRDGWLPGEKVLLALACLLPAGLIVLPTPLAGPAAWAIILVLAWWRAARFSPAPSGLPSAGT